MEENMCFQKWGDPNIGEQEKKHPQVEEVTLSEKWGGANFSEPEKKHQESEEEEETLSLCDLPVSGENQEKTEAETRMEESDFDFGSWGGSVLKESEMCVADEVFFQGQILPFSSENGGGLVQIQKESQNPICRVESMERSCSDGFTSLSSRSNSIGSHNSSTTTTTTTTNTTTSSSYKPKLRNQFHSHPSPKPQILSASKNVGHRSRKSTKWGVFKVGLIRTPEIELQELKHRNSNKNRSFNSRSSSENSSSRKSYSEMKTEEKKKTERSSMFESCKCSVDAIETVIIVKKKKKKIIISSNEKETKEEEVKENEKERKQALYHKRTFEWLKELSIADVPEEM